MINFPKGRFFLQPDCVQRKGHEEVGVEIVQIEENLGKIQCGGTESTI